MSSVSTSQFTLNFEPSIADRWPTLRAYDMDMSPSTLTRKLNPHDGDTQRFNLDDLEGYIQATGDVQSVIEYLASKYADNDDARKARTLAKVESLLPELAALIGSLKGGAA